jgi:catechol 2,3-dioxygenase-like lactoylglutathione lyase family enzyme
MRTQPPPGTGMAHFHRVVSDMKVSIDFYVRLLGFFYDHGVPDTAWLTRPGMLLTLALGEPRIDHGNYFGLALACADELEQRYQWLYERRQRLSAPPTTSNRDGHFYLYDPDDYPVIFSWTKLEYPDRS